MAKRKRRRSVARRRYRRNPMASVLFHGKPSSQKRWRRSGFRRNPISLSPRGLIRGVMEGAKDGAAIFGGEVVQTKARNAIQGFLPDTMRSTKSGGLIATIAAALVTSMIASRFLPGQIGRGVAGGAWAGAVRSSLVIAAPDVAGQLGAYQGYAEYAVQGGGDPLYLGDAGDVPMLGAGMGAYQEYPDVIPVMAS